MLEQIILKLKGFKKESFSFLEILNSTDRDYRYTITVFEDNGKVLDFNLAPEDNLLWIIKAVSKEHYVTTIVVTDYKTQKHYWKRLK